MSDDGRLTSLDYLFLALAGLVVVVALAVVKRFLL